MSKLNAPLYNTLIKYADTDPIPFHMPGHKMGKGLPEDFLKNAARIDLTEIPGTDNLHYPEGIIEEAQELAARAFGAERTFFLVNGSTCGIQAMIMAMCKPGDKLIVGRDCHKSVIAGMILGGVQPVYIKPELNKRFGIMGAINPLELEQTLRDNTDARGVLITRPNYYGICSDIEQIAEVTHSHGKILAVDEAHGAHLGFHNRLPISALEAGADICVQSAHKTLPAFTQGSYIHAKSKRMDMERLKFYLSILQTSSPSYVIMASLDIARGIMQEYGEQYLDELLQNIQWLEKGVDSISSLRMLKGKDVGNGEPDRTRIVINTSSAGKTGFHIERVLRDKYNIQVEMSDINNIVCIASISDGREDFEKLYEALAELSREFNSKPVSADIYIRGIEIPGQGIALKDIMKSKSCRIKLDSAVGRISRDMITPYPPGIPLICPGEAITQEAVDYINDLINWGATVNGIGKDLEVDVVK